MTRRWHVAPALAVAFALGIDDARVRAPVVPPGAEALMPDLHGRTVASAKQTILGATGLPGPTFEYYDTRQIPLQYDATVHDRWLVKWHYPPPSPPPPRPPQNIGNLVRLYIEDPGGGLVVWFLAVVCVLVGLGVLWALVQWRKLRRATAPDPGS